MKKRKGRGSSRVDRKTGSTSSASKKDDAVAETSTQETQPTQEAEEATVTVGSQSAEEVKNEDEVKEDQAEKEEEEAKPDSPTHRKSQDEDAKEDQEEEDKEEAKEDQEEEDKEEAEEDQAVVKEETKPDSAMKQKKGKNTSKNDDAQGGASSSQPALRRGKRKRSTGNETEKKPTPRAKRARTTTTKPQEAEPEYFKDKRNLEDLWKDAFPVGTEWDQQDALYEFNWDFKNLEEALEKDGMLHGKKVYVFGCTESHIIPHNNENKTVLVPAVVCIDSSIPPCDKIGVASAQGGDEEIIPMKNMKMAWVPYVPLEKRDRPVDRMNLPIFILGCTQRRSALKHLKEDRVKKFNYCLPYINNPFKEDESEQSTLLQITFPSEPPVVCEYDWETDTLEEFIDDLIKKGTLVMDQTDDFNVKQKFVKEQIDNATVAYKEVKESRDKATEGMSEETKEAYKAMKLYKFYPLPSPDTPDVAAITKTSVINKYFGKADEVF